MSPADPQPAPTRGAVPGWNDGATAQQALADLGPPGSDEPLSTSPWALASQPPARPRLLVVDDQIANIQALYQVFAHDHQVFMATRGAQALALCHEKKPDVVLLDIGMPDMDGYTVCQQLKASEDTQDIPVIFVTAHGDEEAETRGLDVGGVDFIVKPINPRIVRARVRNQVTLKHQADLLRGWVFVDGLTGLFNRRYFDHRCALEISRSLREHSPLTVMMMDVDYFKRYNDHYGHQMGDDCLRRVAWALKRALRRPADVLARYGGEEFVCVLPSTDFEGGMLMAQRFNQAVLEQHLPHAASDVATHVTISVGVCTRQTGPGHDVPALTAALMHGADRQLYKAKTEGRHRVCGQVLE
ncbi:diguanylate cyclase domain-containing protein [Amphibiibacter pelophylacis]|uniref:Diguanylate cyclase n=1 Tax=Amphibiibacter pelophylacis TaxID=1799477 RepID=A0ACC6P2Q9_9BURK